MGKKFKIIESNCLHCSHFVLQFSETHGNLGGDGDDFVPDTESESSEHIGKMQNH